MGSPKSGGPRRSSTRPDPSSQLNAVKDTGKLAVGEFDYECQLCHKIKGNACYKLSRYGIKEWFLHCHTASCSSLGGAYLRELAGVIGIPGGGATLKEDPRPWLRPVALGNGRSRPAGKAEQLPSEGRMA